jgi:hypothetical protein
VFADAGDAEVDPPLSLRSLPRSGVSLYGM